MKVILIDTANPKVTAGFMCPPLKSPNVQAMAATMKPIPTPVCTGPPTRPAVFGVPQAKGRAHCTDTNMKVATASTTTSLQKAPVFHSSERRRLYSVSFILVLSTFSLG